MIKEALQYIVGMGEAKTHDILLEDESTHEKKMHIFSDKPLYRIKPEIHLADPVEMSTLSSLVDYIKAEIDNMADKMIIHVVSPTRVKLYSKLVAERNREYVVDVNADIPKFDYGTFINHETFTIGVQSKFIDDLETDKELVLKFAGTVESGTVAQYSDDGVSQKATVKTGIASKGEAVVPSLVKLRPFRTFVEVEQPVSDFIFRMKEDKYDGIQCAIFEADGGAWKNAAKRRIKEYLQHELSEYLDRFIVIS